MTTLRLLHLYPDHMNIYADRGNIAVLARRLEWRGLRLDLIESGPGESIDPDGFDLFYLGGGQDRDQVMVAEDLRANKAAALATAVADGAAGLCVCGGYQLAGHGYTGSDGGRMPGIGLLDLDTVAGPTRLIGDLVIEADLGGVRRTVVGFENHAGRTRLGTARPLGRVIVGHGNNGEDHGEGAVSGRLVGTYLHGPLLPKNPWVADMLIGWGLARRAGDPPELEPLDDALAEAAGETAIARAGRRR